MNDRILIEIHKSISSNIKVSDQVVFKLASNERKFFRI